MLGRPQPHEERAIEPDPAAAVHDPPEQDCPAYWGGSGAAGRLPRAGRHDPPAILDVEASGFGRGSYPIEVGYVLEDGRANCMLVRPAPHWTHWDPAAERLHHLQRQDLLRYGLPIPDVVEELNYHLCGRTLYTDNWAHDYSWLASLYEEARRVPTFRLENLRALLTEDEIGHWAAARAQVEARLALPRHRACADARLLQATFGRLRALPPQPAEAGV